MGTLSWGHPFGYAQFIALPGYKVYFDSSIGVSQAGGLVSAWADRNGIATATASGSRQAIYTPNAQLSFPSVKGDKTAVWMPTNSFAWGSNVATWYFVARFNASANGAVAMEFGDNTYNAAGIAGYTWRYLTLGGNQPGYGLSCGHIDNELDFVIGADTNTDFRAMCCVWNRGAVYPVTVVSTVPAFETLWYDQERKGASLVFAQSNATTNFGTLPLNFFAANNGGTPLSFSGVEIIDAVGFNAVHSTTQTLSALQYLKQLRGV